MLQDIYAAHSTYDDAKKEYDLRELGKGAIRVRDLLEMRDYYESAEAFEKMQDF